ncbi:unnamed protein product, partial [marine sediment metagenome]
MAAMKPKGIRKRGAITRRSGGYTGVNVDLMSTISNDVNTIEETVSVNPNPAQIQSITEP